MKSTLAAVILAAPLLFCSPQTTSVPVVPVGSALPAVATTTIDASTASAAGPISPVLQQRIDAANDVLTQSVARYAAGTTTIDEIGMWSERLFAAQKEALSQTALYDAGTARVSQWKKIEALTQQKSNAGAASPVDVSKARYFRASAELDLSRI